MHHGLWDHDNSSASLLIDATIDGRPRKLVAQPSKQGWLYVFDRITGQPIWPIGERRFRRPTSRARRPRRRSRSRRKPPAFSRTFVSKDDVIDFTPQLRQQALDNLSKYRWEQSPFVPPALLPTSGGKLLGSINIGNASGGVNWPGSGFDPETAIFYTQAGNSAVTAAGFGGEEFEFIRVENQTQGRGSRGGKRIRNTAGSARTSRVRRRRRRLLEASGAGRGAARSPVRRAAPAPAPAADAAA